MPELPEVETVRRGLEPVLAGRRIAEAVQRRADLRWPLPERFAERLEGRRVLSLGRRAKILLAHLDEGPDGTETWMIHLGMSGRILIEEAPALASASAAAGARMVGAFVHDTGAAPAGHEPGPHDHVSIRTDDGTRIHYNDARRFGAMDLWPTEALEQHPTLARLGPEPLGNAFGGPVLAEALEGRRTPVKAALLDQSVVAGLGNIYVCEALHRAGIHPRRLAGSLSPARAERLAAAIRETLLEAIEAGGSSLRDYRRTDGELGYFQHAFRVYGRTGEPCRKPGCPGRILRIVQSNRSTFYCSRCQR